MLDKKIKIISLLILSLLYTLNISLLRSDNLNECIKRAISKSKYSFEQLSKTEGANGLKLSLNFIFKFNSFCIFSDLGSAKIDLPPKALGPNSILP